MWARTRAQMAELDELEKLQRERALTDAETDQLAALVYREKQRARLLQDQIRKTRAKLRQLEELAA
jgi:hypothetical protein